MEKKIFSAKLDNDLIYIKSYRKSNALRFLKKRDSSISPSDISIVNKNNINPSIRIIDELYPELVDKKQTFDGGKYYNMFK
ncbi:MAG: hypothetical protein ACOC2W_02610 [bacterium]